MSKKKLLLVCLFTGVFGGHYFVVGNIKKGLLYMFTAGLAGIGWIADLYKILFGINLDKGMTCCKVKYGQDEFSFQYEELDSPEKYPSDYIALDFETTGLCPEKAQIIQVAAIKYRNFVKVDQFTTFVNPKVKIPAKITSLTGITDKLVIDAPVIEEILPSLLKFLHNDIILAHNASFDLKFLVSNLYRYRMPIPCITAVDTLKMSRKYIKDVDNYKLSTLKEHLNIQASSHLADEDCYVCSEVYRHCMKIIQKERKIKGP